MVPASILPVYNLENDSVCHGCGYNNVEIRYCSYCQMNVCLGCNGTMCACGIITCFDCDENVYECVDCGDTSCVCGICSNCG